MMIMIFDLQLLERKRKLFMFCIVSQKVGVAVIKTGDNSDIGGAVGATLWSKITFLLD
jgi:hypothetical protein